MRWHKVYLQSRLVSTWSGTSSFSPSISSSLFRLIKKSCITWACQHPCTSSVVFSSNRAYFSWSGAHSSTRGWESYIMISLSAVASHGSTSSSIFSAQLLLASRVPFSTTAGLSSFSTLLSWCHRSFTPMLSGLARDLQYSWAWPSSPLKASCRYIWKPLSPTSWTRKLSSFPPFLSSSSWHSSSSLSIGSRGMGRDGSSQSAYVRIHSPTTTISRYQLALSEEPSKLQIRWRPAAMMVTLLVSFAWTLCTTRLMNMVAWFVAT